MNTLVRQQQFGDITFGLPENISALHVPFGFYKFLGVKPDSSEEDIKKAYRNLAAKLHPDNQKTGNEESFKQLQRIGKVLMDDGGNLGREHSRRTHYDEVSRLDELFDNYIKYKGDRTKKFSELRLIQLEMELKRAQFEAEICEKNPRFREVKARFDNAKSGSRKEKAAEELNRIIIDSLGIDQTELRRREEERKEYDLRDKERKEKIMGEMNRNPDNYTGKILDLFYLGQGTIEFGRDLSEMRIGAFHLNDKGNIFEVVCGKDCYVAGFEQVHCKAVSGTVLITDPNLTGIVHNIKGSIEVSLPESSYGDVIRARAPYLHVLEGFKKHGDLYIPENFATQNWQKKKPALDLAVKEGSISLRLESKKISQRHQIYSSLEEIIGKNDIYNKIKKDFYKI